MSGAGHDDANDLRGVTAARDTPAVAVWGDHFVWWSADGDEWARIDTDEHVEQAALSRDGVLFVRAEHKIAVEHDGELRWSELGEVEIGDGWRALVESGRGDLALRTARMMPGFAAALGDIVIDDDGGAQRLEGDSCPCEGGGQTRELGHLLGHLAQDKSWPDDDCKRGSGVGVHGWSYLLPECPADSPTPGLMAHGPDGREHEMRRAQGACEPDRPVLIATNGRETFGFVGAELWRIDGPRARVLGRSVRGAQALAAGKKLWTIRGAELFVWTGKGWHKVELVEDDC